MIYLDLIFNLSLLVALSVVSTFIEKRWKRNTRLGMLLQGLLFGGIAVLGMLRAVHLDAGVIFDGRTIVLSLCALFFGPRVASVAGVMTTVCRIFIGGSGTIPGLLAILISIVIGLLARFRCKSEVEASSIQGLYLFGLVVHLAILASMLIMLGFVGPSIVMQIGIPMLLLHPIATVLAGKVLSDQVDANRILDALRKSEVLLKETQALSKVGGWAYDIFTSQMTWTDQMYKIYDVKAEEYDPSDIARNLSFYSQESVSELIDAFERAKKQGESYDLELEFIRTNGERIWVRTIGRPQLKEGKVVRINGNMIDITELKQREREYLELIDGMNDTAFVVSFEGRFLEVNDTATKVLGFSRNELLSMGPADIDHNLNPKEIKKSIEELKFGRRQIVETKHLTKNGEVVPVEVSSSLITYKGNSAIWSIARDITNRKRNEAENLNLEAQLAQAQRIEAVGRLAGGVAHDYNNALTVILGYTELALIKVNKDEPLHEDLEQILRAAKHSADVTRQLLAFARKQTISPKIFNLNKRVESVFKILHHLIGENIDLAWIPETHLRPIEMDPSQIDQILANLCVNARDAIADVGKVTIETKMVTFDEAYCNDHVGFVPGEFALLAVSDDGCGMGKETLNNLFEPFFTTKGLEEGTGLGLATVYGIVKQNNGFINVYSELNKGTTFKIYLPCHIGEIEDPRKEDAEEIPLGQGEKILLVEDRVSILKIGKRMLESLGYNVLVANRPNEAIKLAIEHAGDINLLITDVVMPEMNGRELSEQLQARFAGIRTLFMSGYTANVIAHRGVLEKGVHFIGKPFSQRDLALKVREALDNTKIQLKGNNSNCVCHA